MCLTFPLERERTKGDWVLPPSTRCLQCTVGNTEGNKKLLIEVFVIRQQISDCIFCPPQQVQALFILTGFLWIFNPSERLLLLGYLTMDGDTPFSVTFLKLLELVFTGWMLILNTLAFRVWCSFCFFFHSLFLLSFEFSAYKYSWAYFQPPNPNIFVYWAIPGKSFYSPLRPSKLLNNFTKEMLEFVCLGFIPQTSQQ